MRALARRFGVLHIGFIAAVGLTGHVAVIALTLWPPLTSRPWSITWELFSVLVLCGIARFLTSAVYRRVRIALDSAFYVASAFAFGMVPAAWMVLILLSLDAIVHVMRGTASTQRGESPPAYQLAQVFYSGGAPALMLLATGILFDLDAFSPRDDGTLAWFLPLWTTAFLVVHYLFAVGSHWLEGARPWALWHRYIVRAVPAEFSLMPIALAMVYGYLHQGIVPFLLLGACALLFNWIYRRARIARDKLDARVQELSTLMQVGHLIASSLERRVLIKNIASETLRLVRHNSRFMIGLYAVDHNNVEYRLFDEECQLYRQLIAPADEGLSGWILKHRQPLLLTNASRDYERFAKSGRYNDPRFHSWLGVPLITYDEVIGVMSVQTERRNAYSEDHLRVVAAIAEQAAVALENAHLYELATVDGLTRLLVRRHFDQRLNEEWGRAQRYGSHFALGLLDLDDFKVLNDTYGHQAGDQVLRATALVVRSNMRAADLAGRYGGEEFAFLLPRTTVDEACTVAERIRADIEALVVNVGGTQVTVRASMGVAGYPGSGVTDVDELVACADEALYRAKGAGKNRVVAAPNAQVVLDAADGTV